jgi:hypothetical protein
LGKEGNSEANKSSKNNTLKLVVGAVEFILAVVALILLIATPALTWKTVLGDGSVKGITAIFGGTVDKVQYNASWAGLLAFIFIAVALVILLLLCVMTLTKKKFALAGICRFVAAGLLIVAGVFVFFEIPAFEAANGSGTASLFGNKLAEYVLTGGWITAGILSIVAGGLSCAEEFLF